jgi:hypothetical protein
MINSNSKINPKIYARTVIAVIMLIVWLLVAVSGVVLWLAPEGQRSGRIPLLLDMTKTGWKEVHLWLVVIMVVITIIHVIIDWKTLRAIIKYMVNTHRDSNDFTCD